MSNSNINKLAKYIVHHIHERGKFYGKFPLSDGYIFTAPSITQNFINFHLYKNNHTQLIYIQFKKTLAIEHEFSVTRFEDAHVGDEPIVRFKTTNFTIEDAEKLIKDLPENDVNAYTQAFKILYPNL